MADGDTPTETPVTTGGETQETGGETQKEENKDSFPSFRKAYQYRGGFDKFVYDQLKKSNTSEETDGE